MLQISPGPLQRPAMRSCYVVWSRERLVVGRIWKKSIGSEGLTHKDMWLLKIRQPGQIKVKPVARILPVYIITKVLVYRRPLMKQKGSYTGTFVQVDFVEVLRKDAGNLATTELRTVMEARTVWRNNNYSF